MSMSAMVLIVAAVIALCAHIAAAITVSVYPTSTCTGNAEVFTFRNDTCVRSSSTGSYSLVSLSCDADFINIAALTLIPSGSGSPFASINVCGADGAYFASSSIRLPTSGACSSQIWTTGSVVGMQIIDAECTPQLLTLSVCSSLNCSGAIEGGDGRRRRRRMEVAEEPVGASSSSSSSSSDSGSASNGCVNRTIRNPQVFGSSLCTRITPILPPTSTISSSSSRKANINGAVVEGIDAFEVSLSPGTAGALQILPYGANGTAGCAGAALSGSAADAVPLNGTCTPTKDGADGSIINANNATVLAMAYEIVLPYASNVQDFNLSALLGSGVPIPSSKDIACWQGIVGVATTKSNGPISGARFCALSGVKCTSTSVPGCTAAQVASGAIIGPLAQGLSPLAYANIVQNGAGSPQALLYPGLVVCTTDYCNTPPVVANSGESLKNLFDVTRGREMMRKMGGGVMMVTIILATIGLVFTQSEDGRR